MACPRIIREAYVIEGNTGVLRASPPADYASYSVGISPVLADMYGNGSAELTNGAHVWKFDGKTNTWVDDPSYPGLDSGVAGWAAVADMNPYDGKHQPEIAVASGGKLTIYSLDHSVFMNMSVPIPPWTDAGTGLGGGPPTIADFDNDGLPEVALAGSDSYTVFDPDCQATPRPGGKCASRDHCDAFDGGVCPDFILWSRKTQDHSSNITGSSVFDFAGDGHPEALYADECFARAFSGLDGTVLFSQYHSSCTWLEEPDRRRCRRRLPRRVRGPVQPRLRTARRRRQRHPMQAARPQRRRRGLPGGGVPHERRLRVEPVRHRAVPVRDHRRLLRRRDRCRVSRAGLSVRAPTGRHRGHGRHLPRAAPARSAGDPGVQGREGPVGPVA